MNKFTLECGLRWLTPTTWPDPIDLLISFVSRVKDALNKSKFVIPAQAGIQCFASIRFADCLLAPLQ